MTINSKMAYIKSSCESCFAIYGLRTTGRWRGVSTILSQLITSPSPTKLAFESGNFINKNENNLLVIGLVMKQHEMKMG